MLKKLRLKFQYQSKMNTLCDSRDFIFKNRADLKMHYLNKHYLTSSATKEQKSSKKKRNKKNPGRNSTFSLMMKMRKQMKCGKPLCIFLNVSIPFKIETFWGKCHNLIFMSPSNSSIKCSSYCIIPFLGTRDLSTQLIKITQLQHSEDKVRIQFLNI